MASLLPNAKSPPALIVLSREDLTALMPFGDYVDAVADAFRMHAEGRAVAPPPMHIPAAGGGFHVKAGSLPIGPGYAAFKVNGNFPDNRATHGLPTIQGAILLFDTSTGSPVALLDSIEITIKRTGAATAVAARYLARPESQVATIWGCGAQGRIQLGALRHALDVRRVFLIDQDAAAAEAFAAEIAGEGLDVDLPVKPRLAARARRGISKSLVAPKHRRWKFRGCLPASRTSRCLWDRRRRRWGCRHCRNRRGPPGRR